VIRGGGTAQRMPDLVGEGEEIRQGGSRHIRLAAETEGKRFLLQGKREKKRKGRLLEKGSFPEEGDGSIGFYYSRGERTL